MFSLHSAASGQSASLIWSIEFILDFMKDGGRLFFSSFLTLSSCVYALLCFNGWWLQIWFVPFVGEILKASRRAIRFWRFAQVSKCPVPRKPHVSVPVASHNARRAVFWADQAASCCVECRRLGPSEVCRRVSEMSLRLWGGTTLFGGQILLRRWAVTLIQKRSKEVGLIKKCWITWWTSLRWDDLKEANGKKKRKR